jgi:hypothetical protein
VRGLVNAEGVPLAESFKAVAAPVGLARAGRYTAVVAVFDDDSLSSRGLLRTAALPASTTFGALLQPPTGARILVGLPDIDAHLYMGQCLIFLRQFPLAAAALQHFIAMAQLQGVAGVSPALLQRGRQLLDHVVRPHLPAPAPAASPAALKPRPAAVAAPNAAAAPTAVTPTTFSRPNTAPMEISR